MFDAPDREIIHPPGDNADHAVPERDRQHSEEHRVCDMPRAEPPVEQTERCRNTRPRKNAEYYSIDAANRRRLAPHPERVVGTLTFQCGVPCRKRYVKLTDPPVAR